MAQFHWQCVQNDGSACLGSFDGDEEFIKSPVKNPTYSSQKTDVSDDEALASAVQTVE